MRIMFLECNDFQIKSKKNTIITLDARPACFNTNISLIPLTRDETYELNLRPKDGWEMKFLKSSYSNS